MGCGASTHTIGYATTLEEHSTTMTELEIRLLDAEQKGKKKIYDDQYHISHREIEDVLASEKFILKEIPIKSIKSNNDIQKHLAFLKSLDHPNISKTFHYFSKGESYYVISQYIKGYSILDLLLGAKSISEDDTKTYIASIIDGLEYLYYRDNSILRWSQLLPANIVINTNSGKPILQITNLIQFSESLIVDANSTASNENTKIFLPLDANICPSKSNVWMIGMVTLLLLTGSIPAELIKMSNISRASDYLQNYNAPCSTESLSLKKPEIFTDNILRALRDSHKSISENAWNFIKICLRSNQADRASLNDIKNSKWLDTNSDPYTLNEDDKKEITANIEDYFASKDFRKIIYHAIAYRVDLDIADVKAYYMFKRLDPLNTGLITREKFSMEIRNYKLIDKKAIQIEMDSLISHHPGINQLTYNDFLSVFTDKKLLNERRIKIAFYYFATNKTKELKEENYALIKDDKSQGIVTIFERELPKGSSTAVNYVYDAEIKFAEFKKIIADKK